MRENFQKVITDVRDTLFYSPESELEPITTIQAILEKLKLVINEDGSFSCEHPSNYFFVHGSISALEKLRIADKYYPFCYNIISTMRHIHHFPKSYYQARVADSTGFELSREISIIDLWRHRQNQLSDLNISYTFHGNLPMPHLLPLYDHEENLTPQFKKHTYRTAKKMSTIISCVSATFLAIVLWALPTDDAKTAALFRFLFFILFCTAIIAAYQPTMFHSAYLIPKDLKQKLYTKMINKEICQAINLDFDKLLEDPANLSKFLTGNAANLEADILNTLDDSSHNKRRHISSAIHRKQLALQKHRWKFESLNKETIKYAEAQHSVIILSSTDNLELNIYRTQKEIEKKQQQLAKLESEIEQLTLTKKDNTKHEEEAKILGTEKKFTSTEMIFKKQQLEKTLSTLNQQLLQRKIAWHTSEITKLEKEIKNLQTEFIELLSKNQESTQQPDVEIEVLN